MFAAAAVVTDADFIAIVGTVVVVVVVVAFYIFLSFSASWMTGWLPVWLAGLCSGLYWLDESCHSSQKYLQAINATITTIYATATTNTTTPLPRHHNNINNNNKRLLTPHQRSMYSSQKGAKLVIQLSSHLAS